MPFIYKFIGLLMMGEFVEFHKANKTIKNPSLFLGL